MSSGFTLHERLAADTLPVCDLTLCKVLLMNDARYAWLILVPQLENLRELHEVPAQHRETLFNEIESVSQALQQHIQAHKLNVAALGNQVPQLHIHVIARQTDDAAWPGPVWGVGDAEAYDTQAAADLVAALRSAIS